MPGGGRHHYYMPSIVRFCRIYVSFTCVYHGSVLIAWHGSMKHVLFELHLFQLRRGNQTLHYARLVVIVVVIWRAVALLFKYQAATWSRPLFKVVLGRV